MITLSFTIVILTISGILYLIRLLFKAIEEPIYQYPEKEGSVKKFYDHHTHQGILEYYWGDHVHLGYYDAKGQKDFRTQDFKETKNTFVKYLLYWAIQNDSDLSSCFIPEKDFKTNQVYPKTSNESRQVLDLGCGIGGTTRLLARNAIVSMQFKGISLSSAQIERAKEITEPHLKPYIDFTVTNALNTSFADAFFDLIWICESTEHIDDMKRLSSEVMRMLKPGGRVIIAKWTKSPRQLERKEVELLSYIEKQWSHSSTLTMEETMETFKNTGVVDQESIMLGDITKETLPSLMHQIYLGVIDPLPWIFGISKKKSFIQSIIPSVNIQFLRDAWCIYKLHQALKGGMIRYSIGTFTKVKSCPSTST